MKISRLLAGTALALSMASAASAAPIDGTFAGAIAVSTPGFFITTTGVTGSTLALGAGVATSLTGTGDLSGVVFGTGISGVTTPFTLANGGTFAFTLAGFGSFTGIASFFDLDILSGTSRVVDFYALGTFTPTFGGFTAGPASVTASLSQTGGAGGAVSFGFSFSSPPTPPPVVGVPEPLSLALFGLGLAGLGVAMRRKA